MSEQEQTSSRGMSRREFLEWLKKATLTTTAVAAKGIAPNWLLGIFTFMSQKDEEKRHPTEADVTLYEIKAQRAQNRDGFTQQFEAFLPDMFQLESNRSVILGQLRELDSHWEDAYLTTELVWVDTGEVCSQPDPDLPEVCVDTGHWDTIEKWEEPGGMKGYHKTIADAIDFYQFMETGRLRQVPGNYPVDHTQSRGTGRDVLLQPFVPEFYEEYQKNLRKVNWFTVTRMAVSAAYAVLEYKGVDSLLRTRTSYPSFSSHKRSMYQTFLGTSLPEEGNFIQNFTQVAYESFSEHLKNAGLFEAVQAALVGTAIYRNLAQNWEGKYENEEAATRAFVAQAFTQVNRMGPVELGTSLGLSSASAIRNEQTQLSHQYPTGGYGFGNGNIATLRESLRQKMELYAQAVNAAVTTHSDVLRDILLADRISGYETGRLDTLVEPADTNADLLLLALLTQIFSGIFYGYHRDRADAVFDSLNL